jgi:glycosyltransferase involved in cell wall biosynthesis
VAEDRPTLLVVADSVEGGLGAAAVAHVRWFAEHGYRAMLAAPGASAVGGPGGRHDTPPVASALDPSAVWRAARDLRRLTRRVQPAVVHAHGTRSQLVCLLAGRRPFVTMHGAGGRVAGQGAVGTAVRRAARRLAARAAVRAYSAAPTGGGWQTLLHASPRLADLRRSAVPEAAVPTMLWVGRLDEPKRPELFVEACAVASRQRPLRGRLVGDGPARQRLEEQVARLGAPVDVAGAVDDVAAELAAARAVCLFSDFEGVPFAVQEAMWAGRPVVISSLPSLTWFAGDGDGARWADDVATAARALVELADHASAVRAGDAAAGRVRSMLSPDSPFPRLAADYADRLSTSR